MILSKSIAAIFTILMLNVSFGESPNLQRRIQQACQSRSLDHHVDDSADSLIERLSGGRTFEELLAEVEVVNDYEDERECLQRRGVYINDRLGEGYGTTTRDVEMYFSSCTFSKAAGTGTGTEVLESLAEDVERAVTAQDLINRDALANGVWQDLANRTSGQLQCRMNDISYVQNDQAQFAKLTGQVDAQLSANMTRLRELILAKRTAETRNREEVDQQYNSQGGCDGGVGTILGLDFCSQVSAARTVRDVHNYEREMAIILSQMPYGYEPSVADSLIKMADEGSFNPRLYYDALTSTFNKYKDLNKYYEDRRVDINNNGNPYYCVDYSFKESAAAPFNPNNPNDFGVVGRLLEATTEANFLRPSQRIILECKIGKKYSSAEESTDNSVNAAFIAGGLGAAVLSAAPSGGGSLVAFGAAVSIGFSAVSLADQLSKAHAACWKDDFVISPGSGQEACNPRENFEHELDQFSKSECIREIGWSVIEAIPIPIDVRAAVRAQRGVPTANMVNDINAGTYENYLVEGEEAIATITVTANRSSRSGASVADAAESTVVLSRSDPQSRVIQFTDTNGTTRLRNISGEALTNSQLDDSARAASLRAQYPELNDAQIDGVIRNHNGVDAAGNPLSVTDEASGNVYGLSCAVGTCNSVQLRAKIENLTSLGVSREAAADMIRRGYAGQPNPSFAVASDGVFSQRPLSFDSSSLSRSNKVELLAEHPNATTTNLLQGIDDATGSTQVRLRVERTGPDGSVETEELFGYFKGSDRNGEALYFENGTGITTINPNDPNLVIKSIDLPSSRVVNSQMQADGFTSLYETNPQRAIANNQGRNVEVRYALEDGEILTTSGEIVEHEGRLQLRSRNSYNGDDYTYSRIDDIEIESVKRIYPDARWDATSARPDDLAESFEAGMQVNVSYQRNSGTSLRPTTEDASIAGEYVGVIYQNNEYSAGIRLADGTIEYVPLNSQNRAAFTARAGSIDVYNPNGVLNP